MSAITPPPAFNTAHIRAALPELWAAGSFVVLSMNWSYRMPAACQFLHLLVEVQRGTCWQADIGDNALGHRVGAWLDTALTPADPVARIYTDNAATVSVDALCAWATARQAVAICYLHCAAPESVTRLLWSASHDWAKPLCSAQEPNLSAWREALAHWRTRVNASLAADPA